LALLDIYERVCCYNCCHLILSICIFVSDFGPIGIIFMSMCVYYFRFFPPFLVSDLKFIEYSQGNQVENDEMG
jgi:hypothetical protein